MKDYSPIWLNDIISYPEELTAFIEKNFDAIKPFFERRDIVESFDAHIALDSGEFGPCGKLFELGRDIWNIIKEYKLISYHNTRVLSVDRIRTKGLCVLEADSYQSYMKEILRGSPFVEELDLIIHDLEPFLRNERGVRVGLLSFFAPYNLVQSCGKFVKNVGGEIAEFAFHHRTDILEYLQSIGEPITVEFSVALKYLLRYRQEIVIAEIVRMIYCKIQLEFEYETEFYGETEASVPPHDILRILPFSD